MLMKPALIAALALAAGPAAAWTDRTQPNDPNSPAPQPYPTANFCPAGLHPVIWNGAVSCGGTYTGRYITVDSLDDVPAGYVGRVYHLRYGNEGNQNWD